MNLRLSIILIIALSLISCASTKPYTTIKSGEKKLILTEKEYTKELVCLDVRPDINQKFLLYTPPNPTRTLIMFIGGNGKLNISDSGFIEDNKENFPVRIVEEIVKAGIMVVLVDAPQDQQADMGLNTNSFRISNTHYRDIKKVVTYIKAQQDIPVWLLGYSMGNHSASNIAAKFKNQIAGLVISSAVTRWPPPLPNYTSASKGILSLNLDKITVPALIVHHQQDGCGVCSFDNVFLIKNNLVNSPKVEVSLVTGGVSHAIPCGPLGHHGFGGIETQTTQTIIDFIKSN